jgi:hypothetical protein
MTQIVEGFDGGSAEKSWLISYDTFSDPDEVADRITRLRGASWWSKPHEKLGGEIPMDVWVEGPTGRLRVWLTEFGYREL